MIKANKSPVLTANNFGINFVELKPEVFKKSDDDFQNFSLKNSQIARISKCPNFHLSSPISKGIASMRANASFQLEILKSSATPISITFKQKASEVVCGRFLFKTNKNVQAKVVLNFLGTQNTTNYTKILFESEENSVLDVIIFADNGTSFLNFENRQEKNSKINLYYADFSPKISISNVFSSLLDDAEFELNSIYLSSGLVDQNFCVNLEGEKSKTNLNCLGALENEGKKAFKGTINFVCGAKQSEGHEKEFCLLLSDKAVSKSLPMLLSGEEDATGSHSASSGQVDENLLFYLMSRGFSKAEAKATLVRAKFQKHIDKIFDERTKNLVLSKIKKELES